MGAELKVRMALYAEGPLSVTLSDGVERPQI